VYSKVSRLKGKNKKQYQKKVGCTRGKRNLWEREGFWESQAGKKRKEKGGQKPHQEGRECRVSQKK